MQSISSTETEATVSAVGDARDHIEADLHTEMRVLRSELAELKSLLLEQKRP